MIHSYITRYLQPTVLKITESKDSTIRSRTHLQRVEGQSLRNERTSLVVFDP